MFLQVEKLIALLHGFFKKARKTPRKEIDDILYDIIQKMRNKLYTLEDDLKKRLKDPEFRRLWQESDVEYQLARKLIEKRLIRKMSQRELAKKVKTTQAIISRIESMCANPSLGLLKRLAQALNSRLEIRFLAK